MIEQLNIIAQGWWHWMWPMFWQVSVLIILFSAVDLLLRRRVWPQVRYALWLLVLVKLILPPSFSMSTSVISQALKQADSFTAQIRASSSPVKPAPVGLRPEMNTQITDIDIEPFEESKAAVGSVTNEPPVLTDSSDIAGSDIDVKIRWQVYVMVVWLVVMVALFSWAIERFRKLKKFHTGESSGADLPQWFRPLLAETAKKLNLRKLPEIGLSRNVCSPVVFGTFRPVLVLPAATVNHLSRKRMEHILLHELAHIKRGDLLVNTFYMLLQIVYWFNPLLWLLRRKLQHLRELCCDATVARILRDETVYYRDTILEVTQQFLSKSAESGIGLLGMMETSSRLLVRLKWLEKKTWKHRRLRIGMVCAVVALMTVCILPMAKGKKVEAAITSEQIEVTERVSLQPKNHIEVLTENTRPVSVRGRVTDIKLPFTFTIYVLAPDGNPQPGVKIRCIHPRPERADPLVDMVVESDQNGEAEFAIKQADLLTDWMYWFSLADENYVGTSQVGITPDEGSYTFKVLPVEEFELQVVGDKGPVPAAKIILHVDHNKGEKWDPKIFNASTKVISDSSGRARVRFVKGSIDITAVAEAYASNTIRGIRLSSDRPYRIKLTKGNRITGQVRDPNNNPLDKVSISAKKKERFHSDDEFLLKTTADRNGRFVLENASAGEWEVSARSEDPAKPYFIAPVIVDVGESKQTEPIEMIAKEGFRLKGKYVTNYKINVKGDGGLPGIHAGVFEPSRVWMEFRTEEDGSFDIWGFPSEGEGDIRFVGVGGFHNFVKMPKMYSFFKVYGESIRFENVPPRTYEDIEVHYLLAGMVSGTVVDQAGHPLPGVEIIVRPGGRIIRTNDKGQYKSRIPPCEDVTLEVREPSLRQKIFQSDIFKLEEGETVEKDLTVSREQAKLLEHKQGLELSGRVLTEEGQPVAGAIVCLGNTYITESADRCSNREYLSWQGGLFHPANLQSKSDGHFLFNFLLPGKTDVWAEHPQWGWAWMRDIKTDAKDIELRLRLQSEMIRLSGAVLNADREPSEGARILLYIKRGDSLVAQTKSDAEGRFEIEVDPPWTHFRQLTLLCIPKSGPPAWRIMPYCSAENLQIWLKKETVVTGRVVNSKGKGVASATVRFDNVKDRDYGITWFSDEMAEVAPSVHTDAKGNFTINRVPLGGSISLRAEHPDYGSERASNIVATGEGTRIADIQLPDGITIEGTVRFASTNEVAKGIKVRVVRSSKTLSQATTDISGRYCLGGIGVPGFYEMLRIRAEGPGETPEWEGQATVEKELKPGDRLTDIDIYLERPLAFRQKSWRSRRGRVVKGYQVALLNDNDPAYKGKADYEDTVTLYDSSGEQQWRIKGLNACQTIGANHAIVYNPYDEAIWCVEIVGERLIKLGLDGKVILEKEDMKPNALAVDTKTGNVWVLTSEGTIYGKSLIELNPSGQKIQDWDHKGFDIAYSEKDDCFWLVGKKVLKLDKDGKTIFEWPEEFAWVAVSVSINNRDGSAWVMERRHSQVEGSRNRVWVFESGGKVRRKIDLKDRGVSSVAVDSRHGFAWVATSQGVLKLALDGEIKTDIPIQGFSLCIEPDTGYVLISGRDGFLHRLDRNGDLVWSAKTPGYSQKWLCIISRRAQSRRSTEY